MVVRSRLSDKQPAMLRMGSSDQFCLDRLFLFPVGLRGAILCRPDVFLVTSELR